MGKALDRVLSALKQRGKDPKREGKQYRSFCPGHNDINVPSLSISTGKDNVILYCQSQNCDVRDIANGIGLTLPELFDDYQEKNNTVKAIRNSKQLEQKLEQREVQFNTNSKIDNVNSKRSYKDLDDYCNFKSIDPIYFRHAGWQETQYLSRPALKFITDGGLRYRFIDGEKPIFRSQPEYKKCWYRLDSALEISDKYKLPLIYCNGEPSTIVAQSRLLPATTVCSGESGNLLKSLTFELANKYLNPKKEIWLALDADITGRKSSLKRAKELRELNFQVSIIDFQFISIDFVSVFNGYDLADFCKDLKVESRSNLWRKLQSLIVPRDQENEYFQKKIQESEAIKAEIKTQTIKQEIENLLSVQSEFNSATSISQSDSQFKSEFLPLIICNDREFIDIINDANRAVVLANKRTKELYIKNGEIVYLRESDNTTVPTIQVATFNYMYSVLSRCAKWREQTKYGLREVKPIKEIAQDLIVRPPKDLPKLDAVITFPIFTTDGLIISEPGYHEKERLYFAPMRNFKMPDISIKPTEIEVSDSKNILLNELLGDFPFTTDAEKAHTIAAILLPFVRRIIDGNTPLHLIEAPTQGSGKTLLATIIGLVSTGREPAARVFPTEEEEMRKVITAELIIGSQVILFDNITGVLQADSLASALTMRYWTDRVLNTSNSITIENRVLWLATGNNCTLGPDLIRRTIRIRLDPKMESPWLRDKFKHPNIVVWSGQNLEIIVKAILTLIQSWIKNNRISGKINLGSFEQWATVIGGILENSGIPGFLGNLTEIYENAISDDGGWQEFVKIWFEKFDERPQSIANLCNLAKEEKLLLSVLGNGNERSQDSRFGRALTKNKDRIFNNLQIVSVNLISTAGGRKGYKLRPVEKNEIESENGN